MFIELHLQLDGKPVCVNTDGIVYFQQSFRHDGATTIVTSQDVFDVAETYDRVKTLTAPTLSASNIEVYMDGHAKGYHEGYNHRVNEEKNAKQ